MYISRVHCAKCPLLTTCCCGYMSIRTGSILVVGLFVVASGATLIVTILDTFGAIETVYGPRGCIDVMYISLVSIVISILLIVGIVKRKLSLMKHAGFLTLYLAALSFGNMCGYCRFLQPSEMKSLLLVAMGLQIAFLSIVSIYYLRLKIELLDSSASKEVNCPLAVVYDRYPKSEDERELPHHKI